MTEPKNEAEIYLNKILASEDMKDINYQEAFLSYIGDLIRDTSKIESSLNIFIFAKTLIAPHHIDIENKELANIILRLYEHAHLYAKYIHKYKTEENKNA